MELKQKRYPVPWDTSSTERRHRTARGHTDHTLYDIQHQVDVISLECAGAMSIV